MINEEDNELPHATLFFSRRAKLVATVSPEEIKAATQLLEKNQDGKLKNPIEDSSKTLPSEEKVLSSFLKPIQTKPTRSRRVKKQFFGEDLEKEDVENKTTNLSPEVTLSAAAKRRVQKREKERDLELKLIEEENRKLLSSLESTEYNEVEEVGVDTFDNVIVLTITYLSELSRLKCYETDKFSAILPKVAEQFNLKASEVLLSFKEQIIDVDDTPKSLNIAVTDILECIPYKADGNTAGGNQYDTNNLKIFLQSSDSKQKIELLVHKLEKMQNIMEKYSQQRNIPLHLLTFEFDGERITGSETPDDLDMESGNTIDVQVLGPVEKNPKAPTPKKNTPKKRTPRKRRARKTTTQKRGKQSKNNDDVLTIDSDDSEILLCD